MLTAWMGYLRLSEGIGLKAGNLVKPVLGVQPLGSDHSRPGRHDRRQGGTVRRHNSVRPVMAQCCASSAEAAGTKAEPSKADALQLQCHSVQREHDTSCRKARVEGVVMAISAAARRSSSRSKPVCK
eukprot:TRINITY_DN19784_c0_g1_i1.p1 TRINITY_DN19784_c0_g1~~TRINITY_DN19784_c0_g1_i1.p1  ORF type:complete len:127 (-),score=18.01 TRINITY_DN19784_c0_g1_i1:670-1050(-)